MNFIKSDKFGERPDNLIDCVFCVVYTENMIPYKGYKEVSDEVQKLEFPFALMQMRWDGKLGFPGGKVDKGEDLYTAIQREVSEEIGWDFYKEEFNPISTFYNDEIATHLFEVKTKPDALKTMIALFGDDEVGQFGSEVLGLTMVPLFNSKYGEFDNFIKNNFSASAKLELINFVEEKGFIS